MTNYHQPSLNSAMHRTFTEDMQIMDRENKIAEQKRKAFIKNRLKKSGIKNNRDLGRLIDNLLNTNKIMSRQDVAKKIIKKHSKNWTYDEKEEVIREINQQIVQTKYYLEKKYGIKNITLEKAIKQTYSEEKFELFIKPYCFPKYSHSICISPYIAENHFFYKKEEHIKRYIKSHTKCKKINALIWD